MPLTGKEKIEVYLKCKTISSSDDKFLRKLTTESSQKKVKGRVEARLPVFRPLADRMGLERLVQAVHHLLQKEILQSEAKAREAFPELFSKPSAEQDIQHEISEVDAAECAAEKLRMVMVEEESAEIVDKGLTEQTDLEHSMESGRTAALDGKAPQTGQSAHGPKPTELDVSKRYSLTLCPSLYPIYVPYTTQHLILNEVQRLLEEACWEFFMNSGSPIPTEKQWDCPSAGELTNWTWILSKGKHRLPMSAFHNSVTDQDQLARVASGVEKIRHGAVHRVRTTAQDIRTLCLAAVELAAALGDSKRTAQIRDIAEELGAQWQGMRANKNALESAAAAELDEIRRQREELDAREKAVLADTVRYDAENVATVGVLVERAVARILHPCAVGGGGDDDDDEGGFDAVGWSAADFESEAGAQERDEDDDLTIEDRAEGFETEYGSQKGSSFATKMRVIVSTYLMYVSMFLLWVVRGGLLGAWYMVEFCIDLLLSQLTGKRDH